MSETDGSRPQADDPAPVALQAKFNHGLALHQQGELADAERIYREVLQQQPNHFDALHLLGVIALQTRRMEQAVELIGSAIRLNAKAAAAHSNLGNALNDLKRSAEALASYDKAIALKSDHVEAHYNRGNALQDLKQPWDALASYDMAIALKPDFAEAHYNRANVLHDLKRPEDALASYVKAVALKPEYAIALYNRGNTLQELKRPEDALAKYDMAIALKPDLAEAHNNRGNALQDLKRPEEALASYERAIVLQPDYAEAYSNRGNALKDLNRPDEALASYDRAIALAPALAEVHNNRGLALQELKRPDEALASYDRAIALTPDLAEAHHNRGFALQDLNRPDEALASYDRAIALKPDYAEAHNNRGNALKDLKRPEDALASYDKAIALKPDDAEVYSNRGVTLSKLKRHGDSAVSYAEALKIDPQFPFAKGAMLHQKMLCCEWKGNDELIAEIGDDLASSKRSAEPFGWQGVSTSDQSLQLCANIYCKEKYPANIKFAEHPRHGDKNTIRIGYLSGEFREQATSQLLVGVLEEHDKKRFEVYCLDNGWDDQSGTRNRINSSVDNIIDISRLSDSSAAATVFAHQIDILINLNGYFGEHRTHIFAQRPAPIQVNYLGFPGTLGASYIDYIIADRHVIPENDKIFYTEKVVYLPNCYQANDRKKQIAARIFSRAEYQLPENGFVFCCFNNNYKIMPALFDTWMRILKQVEGSVLWLIEDNASAARNLKKAAVARGVNERRLIFSERMRLPEHLARHELADLFLDTLPCNAHTTASDALWAGLPLLTCLGTTFSGRVAASLLQAHRLPELITTTLEAYEQTAIDLATHPGKLAVIKHKLVENRLTAPLFDTKLFTRHIEEAFTAMYERQQSGLAPEHLAIASDSSTNGD